MKIFSKKLMLQRLENEQKLDRIGGKLLSLITKLDGKRVYSDNEWQKSSRRKIDYYIRDDDGTIYPINENDIEDVKLVKKKERRCR